MIESVHFIPVGFDFDRLIHPISKGEMEADRVVLFTHDRDSKDEEEDKAAKLASGITDRLEQSFELIDTDVSRELIEIDEIHHYEEIYPLAHSRILDELEEGNEVYVNISSMPRPTAFAFATAADTIITEYQEDLEEIRDRLHTYYVAPDSYLVHEMIEALEASKRFYEELNEDIRVHPAYGKVTGVLEKVQEKGVTEGVKNLDGKMYVEIPSPPNSDVENFEEVILEFLRGKDTVPSTSELAERLAEYQGEVYNESFRSRVQYNVSKLEEKGYVNRNRVSNRLETELSTMGRMWLETR